MSTITCQGCKSLAEHNCGGNIGDIAKVTGYNPVMLHTGVFVYVCPTCWGKVQQAITILRDVFPEDYILRHVYMLHLMSESSKFRITTSKV